MYGTCAVCETSSKTFVIVWVFTVMPLLLIWAIISVVTGQEVLSELKVTSSAIHRTELSSNKSMSLNYHIPVEYTMMFCGSFCDPSSILMAVGGWRLAVGGWWLYCILNIIVYD